MLSVEDDEAAFLRLPGGGRQADGIAFSSPSTISPPAGPAGGVGRVPVVGGGCTGEACVNVDQNKDAPRAQRRVGSLGTWAGFNLEVTPLVDPQGGRGGNL